MSKELFWLAMTLGMTVLLAFPYVVNRVLVRGIGGALANPSPDDKPLAPWAQRAQRAHANAVENLVVFAPAVLAVQAAGLSNSMTAMACAIFFFSRLGHYVVYLLGIPGLRTLAFVGGWVGTIMLIVRLLGLA